VEVTLHLFATLSRYMHHKTKGNSCSIEVDEGTRVNDLCEQMRIPAEKVTLVFLNGVHTKGNEILKEGHRVGVIPPLGGE
jgi:sulfur carrier protein ThiS